MKLFAIISRPQNELYDNLMTLNKILKINVVVCVPVCISVRVSVKFKQTNPTNAITLYTHEHISAFILTVYKLMCATYTCGIYLCICVCLSVCQSVGLPVCLSVCPSVGRAKSASAMN